MNAQLSRDALALVGRCVFQNPDEVTRVLVHAPQFFHLIAPAPMCPRLPRGVEVVFSMLWIDPETESHPIGAGAALDESEDEQRERTNNRGKRSLTAVGLRKICNAAGWEWVVSEQRPDPFNHPQVCYWRAEGRWRDLTMGWLPRPGASSLDLRDGTDQARKIIESAGPSRKRIGGQLVSLTAEQAGEIQLRDKRAKIHEHAETGAMMRALRAAFATRPYTVGELQNKPFLIARPSWVGTDTAEDYEAMRESFLGARARAYGVPAAIPARRHGQTIDTVGEPVPERQEKAAQPSTPPAAATPAPATQTPAPRAICDHCGTRDDVQELRTADGLFTHACRAEACQQLAKADLARATAPAKTAASSTPDARPQPRQEAPRSNGAPAQSQGASRQADGPKARFGHHKGQLLSEIPLDGLQWLADRVTASLSDPRKRSYVEDNMAYQRVIDAELARRFAARQKAKQDALEEPLPRPRDAQYDWEPVQPDDDEIPH